MAGSPKKRARQQAAAQAQPPAPEPAPVLDATVIPNPASYARTRARGEQPPATGRQPPPLRHPVGPATRNAVDRSTVDVMNALAKHIKPGLMVRIERLRPHWCAGWLEDYPLEEPDSLGSFYSYLREEHGGQFYRLTVLGVGEQQLFQTQIPIAGRPLEHSRLIDRAVYEGHDVRAGGARAPSPTVTAPAPGFDGIGLVTLIIEQMRETQRAQLESVRQMVDSSRQQTSDLAAAVLQVRSDARAPSLREQLGEVIEATRAVDDVKRALGATTRRAGAAVNDENELDLAAREATKGFIQHAMAGMFDKSGKSGPAQPPAPAQGPQPVGPMRPVTQQNRKVVLEAVPVSGHQARKN